MPIQYIPCETHVLKHYPLKPDQRLSAEDAQEIFGVEEPVTVLKYETKVACRYLVESSNGERRWLVPANRLRA